MHDQVPVLCCHTRVTNNMADRNELAVMACHAAVRRELAGPECCDEGCCTSDASVAIGGVRCYQFIRVAFPVQAIISYKVQQSKFIVCTTTISNGERHVNVVFLTSWDTEHGPDAQLVKSLEEVIADLDLRHCDKCSYPQMRNFRTRKRVDQNTFKAVFSPSTRWLTKRIIIVSSSDAGMFAPFV
jgi:hypothetical protein